MHSHALAFFESVDELLCFLACCGVQRTGLDGVTMQQPQPAKRQQQQHSTQQQQQQQGRSTKGPHSHPLPDSALGGGSGSSGGSYRGILWAVKRLRRLLEGCQRALLHGVAALADRLNWW